MLWVIYQLGEQWYRISDNGNSSGSSAYVTWLTQKRYSTFKYYLRLAFIIPPRFYEGIVKAPDRACLICVSAQSSFITAITLSPLLTRILGCCLWRLNLTTTVTAPALVAQTLRITLLWKWWPQSVSGTSDSDENQFKTWVKSIYES